MYDIGFQGYRDYKFRVIVAKTQFLWKFGKTEKTVFFDNLTSSFYVHCVIFFTRNNVFVFFNEFKISQRFFFLLILQIFSKD